MNEISNYIAQFSYKTALKFFGKTSKNSFFSPFSIFAALLLTSAFDTKASPAILKHLNYSSTEIPSDNLINQLKLINKLTQTVTPIPKYLNSSSFTHFISKYNFTDDQKYISYKILNKMIKKAIQDPSLNKEQKISSFLN